MCSTLPLCLYLFDLAHGCLNITSTSASYQAFMCQGCDNDDATTLYLAFSSITPAWVQPYGLFLPLVLLCSHTTTHGVQRVEVGHCSRTIAWCDVATSYAPASTLVRLAPRYSAVKIDIEEVHVHCSVAAAGEGDALEKILQGFEWLSTQQGAQRSTQCQIIEMMQLLACRVEVTASDACLNRIWCVGGIPTC